MHTTILQRIKIFYNKVTKYMSFLIKDNESLGKYNEICDKVSSTIKKMNRY